MMTPSSDDPAATAAGEMTAFGDYAVTSCSPPRWLGPDRPRTPAPPVLRQRRRRRESFSPIGLWRRRRDGCGGVGDVIIIILI